MTTSPTPLKSAVALSLSAFFAVLLLASCAGLPSPAKDSDNSLVIGALALDFPDGFFEDASRRIEGNIVLYITNKTKGSEFTLSTTRGGLFYFLSNGSDEYRIESYKFTENLPSGSTVTLGNKLGAEIAVTPRCVQYLGHLTISYGKPKRVQTKEANGMVNNSWDFDMSAARDAKTADVKEFLKGSVWADYEIK